MTALLTVRGITRSFETRQGPPTIALRATDLDVAENDFVTILGPSGCGKSTLLRIVAGLDQPTAGEVLLDGKRIEAPGADRGMVFQSYTLFPWLTVLDNVCFGLRERGLARAEQLEIANGFIAKVGLVGFEHHFRSSSRAACSSARRSPARSPTARASCSWTSPSARSTTRPRELMQELLLGIWEAEREDRALRHARHRRGRLHGLARRRDERAAGADQARPAGADRASAALLGEDDAGVQRAEGGADGAGEGRGAGGAGGGAARL